MEPCILKLTFILHLARRRRLFPGGRDLLLCLIPVAMVSGAFMFVHMPARVFDYFAFFGLLVLAIKRERLKMFAVIAFAFLLITGFFVLHDKQVFFETSDGELEAAGDIAESFSGTVFSDQRFVNLLVVEGYYNVTGADDMSPLTIGLFYENNRTGFLQAMALLAKNSVDYVAITKRMREQYVLMLNRPQKPIRTLRLFEENLDRAYDNGDVALYEVPNTG